MRLHGGPAMQATFIQGSGLLRLVPVPVLHHAVPGWGKGCGQLSPMTVWTLESALASLD
jgi:hypothetical protein